MKKILIGIMMFSMLTVSLAACSFGKKNMTTPNIDATKDVTMPQSATKPEAEKEPDTSKFIGEEKAKELALKKAGISTDGVIFDHIELDYDDGIWQYEVDFRHGKLEYDVDINAENGEILEFEKTQKFR